MQILEQLYNLKRDKKGSHERPHKPVLLLTVLELIEQGLINQNKILFTDELISKFKSIFEVVRLENDKPTIQNPFFYLTSEPFWDLKDSSGKSIYIPGNVGKAPAIKTLKQSFAILDQSFYTLLQNQKSRNEIRNAIICRYFPKKAKEIRKILSYVDLKIPDKLVADSPTRSSAFAKTVKNLYDYRCAACGLRIKYNSIHFVDAAHIKPFKESYNDHPSNGMALCKNHHWAMDQKLIAPHPDYYWIVSETLDSRITDYKPLLELQNQKVLLPSDPKFNPDKESLEWRLENLLN